MIGRLDEWIYFLKNSEVKDTFRAKGLKEANNVLDIMRLEEKDSYGYNRYPGSLHLKASELFSMQTEEEFKIRDITKKGIARNLIENGFDNNMIIKITGLKLLEVEQLINNQ